MRWQITFILKLPGGDAAKPIETHSLSQARIELELTELVVGWLETEAVGVTRVFPELDLSAPTDLRGS